MRNLRFAVRTLAKSPFVTAVAILSLALGIGANVAIFSLFQRMLLRPLPVVHPEELANFKESSFTPGSHSCGMAGNCDEVFSYQMFRDLERNHPGFSGIAAHLILSVNLAYRNQTLHTEGLLVSGGYFPLLGLRPALGRLFTADDDRVIGANGLVVLSYDYWSTQLGADPRVIGTPMDVNGRRMTVIGVAPAGFEGSTLGARPAVFVPVTMAGSVLNGGAGTFTAFERRTRYWLYLIGRHAPGTSLTRAQAAINAVYKPIINSVEAPLQEGLSAQGMARFRALEIRLGDGRRGQSRLQGQVRTPVLLLFWSTAIVLLIACANIANLLLARASQRSMEMAVRLSLGASRRQLLAQLLTESCVLGLVGGAASILVARATLALLAAQLPAEFAASLHVAVDAPALVFAAALSLGTGFAFGLFPAWHSTRPELATTLRSGSGKLSGARAAARVRTSLVTSQIALSMALLIIAGLFVKSLRNVARVDLGIRIDRVVTFGLSPELNGYTPARARTLFGRVEDVIAAIPGVTDVSASLVPVLSNSNWDNGVNVEGFRRTPDTDADANFNEVGTSFFRTLGIPVLAGRPFSIADVASAPKVAMVNEAFARKFKLGREAVGKRMSSSGKLDAPLDIEIVGLVKDGKYSDVKQQIPATYYIPYRQDTTNGSLQFYARVAGDPVRAVHEIPVAIAQLDPNLPVEHLKTLPQQVQENVYLDRMVSTLAGSFAALATLLAAVGLYGVLAYTIAQRTREIGVRMALGANAARVQRLVLRQVGLMTVAGAAIGVVGALALGRWTRSLLFEVAGWDLGTIALSVAVLGVVALGAGFIPALRASRIDPMQALRYE